MDISVIKPGNAPASVSGTTVQSSAGSSQSGGAQQQCPMHPDMSPSHADAAHGRSISGHCSAVHASLVTGIDVQSNGGSPDVYYHCAGTACVSITAHCILQSVLSCLSLGGIFSFTKQLEYSSVSWTSPAHCAGGTHGWAIALGIILGVLLLALVVAALFLLRRRQRRKQASPSFAPQTFSTLHSDQAYILPDSAQCRMLACPL